MSDLLEDIKKEIWKNVYLDNNTYENDLYDLGIMYSEVLDLYGLNSIMTGLSLEEVKKDVLLHRIEYKIKRRHNLYSKNYRQVIGKKWLNRKLERIIPNKPLEKKKKIKI